MTTPCEQKTIIEDIRDTQKEMKLDIKELVRVKNIALGIITASRIIMVSLVGFICWLVGIMMK